MSKSHQFECKNCGFELDYAIGKNSLVCKSCDYIEPIEIENFNVFHSNPYEKTVLNLIREEPEEVSHHVQCKNCGAGFSLPADVHADECPYCDSNIVVAVELQRQLKPDAIIPFMVEQTVADESFKKWLNGLWFAPTELKRKAIQKHPIIGTYMPYWAFDAEVDSNYSGQRGDNYMTTQMVSTRVNGRTVMRRRQVVKIRWRYVAGKVYNNFINVLVLSSEKLPIKLAKRLTNWDLSASKKYNRKYLSGFRSELYQLGLSRAYKLSKQIMNQKIRQTVKRDIGGDHQRISQLNSRYYNVGFKLILAPIWISTFNYKGKPFRYTINGQNGKTLGERPWSVYKIVGAIFFVLTLAGLGFLLSR